MNPNIFRQYDIRGIADRDLTDETIDLVGKAFASYLIQAAGAKQGTDSGKQQAGGGKQGTGSAKQKAGSGKERTGGGKQGAGSGKPGTGGGKEKASTANERPPSSEQESSGSEGQAAGAKQGAGSAEQGTGSGKQQAGGGKQGTSSGKQQAGSAKQGTGSGKQRTGSAKQKADSGKERTVYSERPAADSDEGPSGLKQPRTQPEQPTLVLGRDIRPSSARIQRTLTNALLASGISVLDIGIVTTPVCYFSVSHFNKTGAVMITGSHNPPDHNGLKLVLGSNSVFGSEIQKIRALIEKKDFISGRGRQEHAEIIPAYQDYLNQSFRFERKLKVVVDSGNGTAGLVAPKVLRDFGHEVTELFSEPDSRFPNHHPDPTVEANLKDVIQKVRETKADVGFAFDGDADRIGVIDDRGTIMWGDRLLILFSRFILKVNPGAKFVADVKCSNLFFEEVNRRGGHAIMWKTGHSLIKQKLREEHAVLAGEMSGHMFFADRYFGFDDAVYAALRVLEILDQSGKKLSELLADLPKTYATPEIRVECPDEEKFQIVAHVTEFFKRRYPTVDIDGVRIDFGDGWGLVRASNTQPMLVTRFEAASEERLAEIRKLVEDKMSEFSRSA